MSTPLPASSLIICSRNRPVLLRETIESVLSGAELPAEIIVVDQSSRPDPFMECFEAPSGCELRYVPMDSIGISRARNFGIGLARYDLLAFIDDDMRVAANWYGCLIRALFYAGTEAAVTGRVLPEEDLAGGFVPAVVTSSEPRTYAGRIDHDVLAAGHMAMHRRWVEIVGLFDERLGPGTRFPAAEDNDYGLRLLHAGCKIIYVPEAVIYHKAWRGQSEYHATRRAYGRGKGGFYARYLSLQDPFMLKRMSSDLFYRLVRFPWRALHRWDLAVGDLFYISGVVSGVVDWMRLERNPR